MMVRIASVMLAAAFISGCGQTPVVERHTQSYATLDPAWIVPCPIVPPPMTDAYAKATEHERNLMWGKIYTQQMFELSVCNQRLGKAFDYNAEKSKEVTTSCNGTPCK